MNIIINSNTIRKEFSNDTNDIIKEEMDKLEKILKLNLTIIYEPVQNYMNVRQSIAVRIVNIKRKDQDLVYARSLLNFTLVQMPGFCGTAVLTELTNYSEKSNKGIGTLLHKIAVKIAKDLGYGTIKLTMIKPDENYSPYYKKIVEKDGFIQTGEFFNPRTTRTVLEYTKDLLKKEVKLKKEQIKTTTTTEESKLEPVESKYF